jgi:peroxiredoxin (alkyl hydroperoxide reductase subunit C)
MSVLNSKIKPFTAQAYKGGKFIEVTEKDVLGKWAVFFFYPADFTFVCPTELEDVADHYAELQKLGVEVYSVSTDTHFCTRHGTTLRTPSARSSTPCWATPPGKSARTSTACAKAKAWHRATFIINPKA